MEKLFVKIKQIMCFGWWLLFYKLVTYWALYKQVFLFVEKETERSLSSSWQEITTNAQDSILQSDTVQVPSHSTPFPGLRTKAVGVANLRDPLDHLGSAKTTVPKSVSMFYNETLHKLHDGFALLQSKYRIVRNLFSRWEGIN